MSRVRLEDQVSDAEMERFSNWLAQERNRRGHTQEKMAQRLQLSTSHYSSLEKNRKKAPKKTLIHIALALGNPDILIEIFGKEVVEQIVAYDVKPMGSSTVKESGKEKLYSTESEILEVPMAPILTWWGFTENQIAHLRLLDNVKNIQHEQLVYVVDLDKKREAFMFADLSDSYKPVLVTPEQVLAHHFSLGEKGWREFEEWNISEIELSKAIPLLFYTPQTNLYRVIRIVDDLQYSLHPFLNPRQRQLTCESQKEVIRQVNYYHKLENRVREAKDRPLHSTPDRLDTP